MKHVVFTVEGFMWLYDKCLQILRNISENACLVFEKLNPGIQCILPELLWNKN